MAKQLYILKFSKTDISENEPRQVVASLINSIIDTVIQLAVKKQKRHTGVVVVIVVGYKYYYTDSIPGFSKTNIKSEVKAEGDTKLKQDMAEGKKGTDNIKEGNLKIAVDGKEVTVHYRQAEPDVCSLDVLFLHGAAFQSSTWTTEPMFSLQHLSKLGYNAVSIDLPESKYYGGSSKVSVDRVKYLEEVIKGLKLKKPVIISPSMSGAYSMPYLFKDPENVLERCRGFVPVAPVGTASYTKEQYAKLKVPTLFIRGTKDKSLGETSKKDLGQLPNFELREYKDAGHPAYLDNPDGFHKDLHEFFQKLLNSKEG